MTVNGAAIIGCGRIGAIRARAMEANGVRVVALYDMDSEAAHRLARTLPTEPYLASSADVAINRSDVDIVVVATNHAGLAPATLLAARAGRHVLVEKPATRTMAEAAAIVDAAKHDVTVAVGYNLRFHPSFLHLRELLNGGRFGPIMHVRTRYGHGGRVGYEREWRSQRELSGGGELLDQGCHLIDMVRHLGGPVELVFCELRTEFWRMDVEDNAFLALRTGDGAFAWLHASWTEWKNLFSFEVMFTNAKAEVKGLGGSYGPERLTIFEMGPTLGPPPGTTFEFPPDDGSWTREVEDLLGELAGKSGFGARAEDAVESLRVIEEAYAS